MRQRLAGLAAKGAGILEKSGRLGLAGGFGVEGATPGAVTTAGTSVSPADSMGRNEDLKLDDQPECRYPKELVYMTWKTSRTNDPGHRWLREEIVSALKLAQAAARQLQ
jgi:hypothetical protein